MAALLTVTVDVVDLAEHFRAEPVALIEALTLLVDGFDDDKAVLRYCDQVAGQHTGSMAETAVAPFLQVLIDRLFHAEAGMGIRT